MTLVSGGFDLAVRFGGPEASSLVARKLLDTRIVTVARAVYPETPRQAAGSDAAQRPQATSAFVSRIPTRAIPGPGSSTASDAKIEVPPCTAG